MIPPRTVAGADFDPSRTYRYLLWRLLDPDSDGSAQRQVTWVMLNPSTADEARLDPTLRRCKKFTLQWGYQVMEVVNLFALRSTDPRALRKSDVPVGGEQNDKAILASCMRADMVVVAWGAGGALYGRGVHVIRMLLKHGVQLHHLGTTKGGHPRHPLYLRRDTKPIRFADAPDVAVRVPVRRRRAAPGG